MNVFLHWTVAGVIAGSAGAATAQRGIDGPRVEQGRLVAPGSAPFHLEATIDAGGPTQVVMDWLAPDMWRRTIDGPNFAQTVIVNGQRVVEHESDPYIPLDLRTLVTAMVDPQPFVDAVKPGDQMMTKANGSAMESGVVCVDMSHTLCGIGRWGLMETIGPAGHVVEFMNYQPFHGKRIARRLIYSVSVGDSTMAEVTKLEDLENPDPKLFAIDEATPAEKRVQVVNLRDAELRALATESPEIIWPQVLDGAQTGETKFYLSLDKTGKLREVLPLSVNCERCNDSAIRQIKRWKFKTAEIDGLPVQAEGSLTFHFDTRAWGPKDVLSDAEARKIATNVVAPDVPQGKYPAGTVYEVWIAVDSDGQIIEQIKKGGPPDLFSPCDHALKQWRFHPPVVNGVPQPFRALIVFPVG